MARDARIRSSIYGQFAEIIGDHDVIALMSQFPSVEADELVTEQFLRAELGPLDVEIGRVEAQLRSEITGLRSEVAERLHRQTVWLASTVVASAGTVIAAVPLLS